MIVRYNRSSMHGGVTYLCGDCARSGSYHSLFTATTEQREDLSGRSCQGHCDRAASALRRALDRGECPV